MRVHVHVGVVGWNTTNAFVLWDEKCAIMFRMRERKKSANYEKIRPVTVSSDMKQLCILLPHTSNLTFICHLARSVPISLYLSLSLVGTQIAEKNFQNEYDVLICKTE